MEVVVIYHLMTPKIALSKFNNITSKYKVNYAATVNTENPYDCNIVMTAFLGDNSDNTSYVTAITTYYDNDRNFTNLRKMKLNRKYFDNNSSFGSNKMKRTIAHETGHVFGLDHPKCGKKLLCNKVDI